MIKVLVVDDSAFMRKMLSEMLEKDSRIHVAGKARNGRDAVEKVRQLDPDVVTMDVEMPVMSGIDALKEIMHLQPKPVIMVSSITKEGADTTIKAMELGAFDFISKPSGSISLDIHKVEQDLIKKVLHAAEVPVNKLTAAAAESTAVETGKDPAKKINRNDRFLAGRAKQVNKSGISSLVAIGTSTGGPKALQRVLSSLPGSFPCPVLIVQHMPKGFTRSLSERLDSISEMTVKEAEQGEIIKKGVAYIAPGGYHLKVRGIGTSVAIHLDQSDLVNGHRPSVDSLFASLTKVNIHSVTAVLMTGMGSDGKEGLRLLNGSVKTTAIAESETTSVVFGMPRAAIETGFVDHVKNLDDIAETIVKYS